MSLLWIAIGPVEICVMLLIVAAAVLAAVIRPRDASPVMTYLYACDIYTADCRSISTQDAAPALRMEVLDDMRVALLRTGFEGLLTDRGAVSISVTVKGCDITIEERIVPGNGLHMVEPVCAVAYIDSLRPSARPLHIYYRSTALNRETALSLAISPGVVMTRTITR